MKDVLKETAEFWNSSPCDQQEDFRARAAFRYRKEPWLRKKLMDIASKCQKQEILEVGCGQGTDALTFCQFLDSSNAYHGIDYSEESCESAQRALKEVEQNLRVVPKFTVANAEALPFPSESFDFVYSMGVLHHTPDTAKAISEVGRVLRKGGVARIALYRTLSPKLLAAHSLRALQSGLDWVSKSDRILYRWVGNTSFGRLFGTAVQECFGVPILRSYTRAQMQELFSEFDIIELESRGAGMPPVGINEAIEPWVERRLGYFWYIECKKKT